MLRAPRCIGKVCGHTIINTIYEYHPTNHNFPFSREPEDDQTTTGVTSRATNDESAQSIESYDIDGHQQQSTPHPLESANNSASATAHRTPTVVTSQAIDDESAQSIESHDIGGVPVDGHKQETASQHDQQDPLESATNSTTVNGSSEVEVIGEWYESYVTEGDKKLDVATPTQPEPAPSSNASVLDDDISFKEEDLASSTKSQNDSFKLDELLELLVGEPKHDVKSEDEI